MIKILADSTCDLSQELIEKHGIEIIPLHIVLNDSEYEDGVDITPKEIYEWSDENKTTPKTSAVSFEKAMNTLKEMLSEGNEVVVLPISDQFSTTGNLFRMVKDEIDTEDRISVVDSMNLSTGIGHLVLEAAIMAEEGKSRQEIVEYLKEIRTRVRASFVVDTLEYLYRGGRCSAVSAFVGGALKLHPKIIVEDGRMDAAKKYRGKMKAVIKHYVKDMEEELRNAKPDRVFITHSGCDRKTVDSVREYLESLNIFDEIIETTAGGVISSHCGPGTLGVLFIEGK